MAMKKLAGRSMDAHRDSTDFRDRIYEPSLVKLASELLPDPSRIHVLNQGEEGACTGFGLAATINYMKGAADEDERVSARMLYEMAKRHDQWPGSDYDGSSARGAMKGWHKNGACSERAWPYDSESAGYFTRGRQTAALENPLGAYYRVLQKRSDVHAALHETGAVFATAAVHDGWEKVTKGGIISRRYIRNPDGGHAFCILGYTDDGFLIQNSWGPDWGGVTLRGTRYEGSAIWLYEDFDLNLWDAWVARSALPVESLEALSGGAVAHTGQGASRVEKGPPRYSIAEHYVHIDDGQFDPRGNYPSSEAETEDMLTTAMKSLAAGSRPGHLLLYAHGGLNSVKSAAARVASWKPVLEKNGIWAIHFIWETGLLASLRDIVWGKDDFLQRRVGGGGEWKDRLIERGTQKIGTRLWREMTEDAALAFAAPNKAGARFLQLLKDALEQSDPKPKIHLMGHSAGSIWLGHLLSAWAAIGGGAIESLQLFAPACTLRFYQSHIQSALGESQLRSLKHYLLDDASEQADSTGGVYGKSLLYLVSRAYEHRTRAVPLMGMERYWQDVPDDPRVTTYTTRDNPRQTRASSHGGFDNDLTTMNHALRVILDRRPSSVFTHDDMDAY